jgi:Dyp-type peroxidase family
MIRTVRSPFDRRGKLGLHPADIQGNILRPYDLGVAAHVFVHVGSAAGGCAALRTLLPTVTSGKQWTSKPRSTLNVSFTYEGLTALGLSPAILASFPDAFRQGMAARATQLGDAGRSDPSQWERGFGTGDAHVLFSVYAESEVVCEAELSRLLEVCTANSLTVVTTQRAQRLPESKEHFGYADGVGQPALEGTGDPVRGEGDLGTFHHWHGLPVGEILLGHIDADGYPSPGPAAPFDLDGTFTVWRKLHEDVPTFRRWIAEQSSALQIDEMLLRAKLIGRWPDASPLALTPDRPDPEMAADPNRVNAFDYSDDPDGLRCPLGAHIRRANPRSGLGFGDSLSARQRIIRRGMTYGPALAEGLVDDDGTDRGIFFIAFMADIERQYEFIQSNWCNDGDIVSVGHDRDPFIGQASGDHKFTIPGAIPKFVHPLVELVTTRGGEYLWTPSMRSLGLLANGSWNATSARFSPPGVARAVLDRVAGTMLGLALAPVASALAFARGRRVVHPVGVGFAAEVTIGESSPSILAGTLFATRGTYPATVRLSRGFGLPMRRPDVHGLAIRIPVAAKRGAPQDLLLATVKRKKSGKDTTAFTARYEPQFSSLLRLGVPRGTVLIRAFAAQAMPDDATIHAGSAVGLAFDLAAQEPYGDIHVVGRVTLGSVRPAAEAEALGFDLSNNAGGIKAVGVLNIARTIVYRASQFGRSLRHRKTTCPTPG